MDFGRLGGFRGGEIFRSGKNVFLINRSILAKWSRRKREREGQITTARRN